MANLARKQKLMRQSMLAQTAYYLFIGYALVKHFGWVEGLGIYLAFSTFIGALRTRTTWDDWMTMQVGSQPEGDPRSALAR